MSIVQTPWPVCTKCQHQIRLRDESRGGGKRNRYDSITISHAEGVTEKRGRSRSRTFQRFSAQDSLHMLNSARTMCCLCVTPLHKRCGREVIVGARDVVRTLLLCENCVGVYESQPRDTIVTILRAQQSNITADCY